ncbi:MAG TPA: thioredoxin [Acidimicrobiia bacterium]
MDRRNVIDITTEEFPQAVLQRSHELPVVVDFWAEWCGPCKVLSPILEQAAERHGGAFQLVKVDADQSPQLAAQFGVQGIPTVIAFKGGQPVASFTGAIPEQSLEAWLAQILPTELDTKVDTARDHALSGDAWTAEKLLREVLDEQPDHPEAGTGLASLLLARNEPAEALIVLGKLAPTPDVERLQAAARLAEARSDEDLTPLEARIEADPEDHTARLELAKALAGRGEFEPALDHLLWVVRAKGDLRDDARQAMLDVFGVLGDEHPLTATYRRQLANALF